MATILSDQINLPVPGTGAGGDCKILFGSHTFAAAASAADVVNMFTIPAGFTPLFGWLMGDDIDTGTEALEIDIGVTGDAQKYLNSGVINGDAYSTNPAEKITVGIKIPLQEDLMTVKPTEVTSDTTCIATITAAANAGGTGTITVILCGVYNDPRVV